MKISKNIVVLVGLGVFFLFVAASALQASETVTPVSSANSVKIVSLKPDPSQPLYVGDRVEIEARIDYSTSQSPATITLNIQRGEGQLTERVVASKSEVLTEGNGTITLKQSIDVPDTGTLQIFTPLILQGQTSTSVADMRFYKVLSKGTKSQA